MTLLRSASSAFFQETKSWTFPRCAYSSRQTA